jgi:hypothetical protein
LTEFFRGDPQVRKQLLQKVGKFNKSCSIHVCSHDTLW